MQKLSVGLSVILLLFVSGCSKKDIIEAKYTCNATTQTSGHHTLKVDIGMEKTGHLTI